MKILTKHYMYGVVIIMFFSFFLKAVNINYNSPFNDEAIYIVVGKLGVFNRDWESLVPFDWMGGVPFFYPTLSTIAHHLGGIGYSRLLNVVFFVLTLPVVCKLALLIYPGKAKNKNIAALLATILLAGSANGYYVSRLATYDMPSFFFLALSVYFLIAAEKSKKYPAGKYFLSFVTLVISFLFKYVTGIFIPILILYSFLRVKRLTKYRKHVWKNYFLLPTIFLLGVFGIIKLSSLNMFFQDQVVPDTGSGYRDIFNLFLKETYLINLFWLLGAIGYAIAKKWKQLLLITAVSLAVFIVHLVAAREHTLDKHLFTTVVGFSVAAGIGISLLLESVIKNTGKYFYWSAIFVSIVLFWFRSYGISESYNGLWVNAYTVLEFVTESSDNGDVVLTETGANMQLAMFEKTHPTRVFTFDWIEYGNLTGEEALERGLRDGYFDIVVLLDQDISKMDSSKDLHELTTANLTDLYTSSFEDENFIVYFKNY